MKKKFINGILMVAMLFAATTSFVSCKDNVDDELVKVYQTIDQVRKDLQDQLDNLGSRISSLEGRMTNAEGEITSLKSEVQTLKGEIDALKGDVESNKQRIADLESRMTALEARVTALEESINELITDIAVQETNSPVTGTINMPGLHANFLAAFYGGPETEIDAFPYGTEWDEANGEWVKSKTGITVDQNNGNRVNRATEIASWVPRIKFNGKRQSQIWTNFSGNAGTLYFSLNPVGVNTENVTFSLVNSLGETSPVELTDVQKSAHKLTWALGKHGNGTSTNDNEASDYLYEATASLPISAWSSTDPADPNYSPTSIDFPYMNVWKQASLQSEIQNMIAELKTAGSSSAQVKAVSKTALQLVQNFYQAELEQRSKMDYWYLQAEKTLTDGTTKKYVAFGENNQINIAFVRPLGYKLFWNLNEGYGKDLLKAYIDIDDIATLAATVIKSILAKAPNFDFSKYKLTDIKLNNTTGQLSIEMTNLADGSYWTDDYARYNAETGTWQYNANATTAVGLDKFLQSFEDGLNENLIAAVNDMIDDLSKQYETITTVDVDAVATKVTNFLSKVSNKLTTALGDHYAYRAVAPIVLFLGPDGVNRLTPGATLKQEFPTSTFIFTSPTEEYLVPAMYKYIAVLKGGKIIEAYVEAGWNKVQDLNLPEGDIEIIYQTMDFCGNVVTKRYPITVIK